jgi:hypothetical protein
MQMAQSGRIEPRSSGALRMRSGGRSQGGARCGSLPALPALTPRGISRSIGRRRRMVRLFMFSPHVFIPRRTGLVNIVTAIAGADTSSSLLDRYSTCHCSGRAPDPDGGGAPNQRAKPRRHGHNASISVAVGCRSDGSSGPKMRGGARVASGDSGTSTASTPATWARCSADACTARPHRYGRHIHGRHHRPDATGRRPGTGRGPAGVSREGNRRAEGNSRCRSGFASVRLPA